MRQQKKIWEAEHQKGELIPAETKTIHAIKPSSNVVLFAEYLKKRGIRPPVQMIDLGCGKGRNSIYFAKQGFKVYGLDYVQVAIDDANKLANQEQVSSYTDFRCAPIDHSWEFPDDFFDLAIDHFSSIDIETKAGREIYRNELLRTLKPGGMALVVVVSCDDEIEKEHIKQSPGSEENSTIWPESKKFQKNYDEAELREFYQDFEILELKNIKKKAHKLNRDFLTSNFWMVIRKRS